MKPSGEKDLICEACRSVFSCSAGGNGCWCFEIKIPSHVLLQIREKYGDCLCRTCLDEMSKQFAAECFTSGND